jgi:uncharacterized protein with PIN domain
MNAEEWYCFKCNQKMEKTRADIEYKGYKLRFDCLKCPSCGVLYEDEGMAKKIVEGQTVVDKKMR